jgi:hypothetical protein
VASIAALIGASASLSSSPGSATVR